MKLIITITFALISGLANAQFPSNGSWGGGWGGSSFGGYQASSAQNHRGNDYGGNEARRINGVMTGRILATRAVTITTQGRAGQYVGAGVGAAIAGIVGSRVGSGTGRDVATVAASAVGGWAGHSVGERVSRVERQALEVVVQLDSGGQVSVTQELDRDSTSLRRGDAVRIIQGANARVVRAY